MVWIGYIKRQHSMAHAREQIWSPSGVKFQRVSLQIINPLRLSFCSPHQEAWLQLQRNTNELADSHCQSGSILNCHR